MSSLSEQLANATSQLTATQQSVEERVSDVQRLTVQNDRLEAELTAMKQSLDETERKVVYDGDDTMLKVTVTLTSLQGATT